MSTNYVEIVEVSDVLPHPNADRLELAQIKGTQVAIGTGYLKKGDKAIYFPADMLIPTRVAEKLNVSKYLKHAIYPGDFVKTPCRIAACRLRGIPSFGFATTVRADLPDYLVGADASEFFEAVKYEPPARLFHLGQREPDLPQFHRYTDIEHYWRFPDAMPEGTPVRITEKLHGTNSRVGLINMSTDEFPEFEFVAGSHHCRLKTPETGSRGQKYWEPLGDANVLELLSFLCAEVNNVILFGEIYGPGIQDMDYGEEGRGYRVFDITVNGQYLDWDRVKSVCATFGITTVPLLYEGTFVRELVERYTYGPTVMASPDKIQSKFKDREGCVITPLHETYSSYLNGRLILKSVSADYLDRKGAIDDE